MKKMDVGQSVSVLANAGVLVGIVLLLYELHQNRESMQAQTRSNVSDTLASMLFQEANNPELVRIQLKARGEEPLTDIEAEQYSLLQASYWRYRENVSYQYRNGLYEQSEYLAQRAAWIGLINGDNSVRTHWCSRRGVSVPEFFAEINALIERPCD